MTREQLALDLAAVNREEWRVIPGWPDYEISRNGVVRSWRSSTYHGDRSGQRPAEPRLLKARPDVLGYLRTMVTRGKSERRTCHVHTLVLETYVGPRPHGMQARHLNGNRADPRLENLAWGTPSENSADKAKHGTVPRGEAHSNAKLTEKIVRYIFSLRRKGLSLHEIAAKVVCNFTTIDHVVHGKSWAHLRIRGRAKIDNRLLTRGERSKNAKLKEADIHEIFRLAREGLPQEKIGARFGIDGSTINMILRRKRWAHVSVPGTERVDPTVNMNPPKLTEADIPRIFALRCGGMKPANIAREYGVSPGLMTMVLQRKRWGEVEVPAEVANLPPTGKLTAEDIPAIFAMHREGASQYEIAERFGISRPMVANVLKRRQWAHVPVCEVAA